MPDEEHAAITSDIDPYYMAYQYLISLQITGVFHF